MDSQKRDRVCLAWDELCELKGEPPTVDEVQEREGGNREAIRQICAERKQEYERRNLAANHQSRKRLALHVERLLAAALEEGDERVRTLQSAHASALDAVGRERDTLRNQLGAAQVVIRELEEQKKGLEFELQGVRTQAAADERIRVELDATVRRLLQEAVDASKALAEKEAENGRLRAELQRNAEDRLTRAEDLLQTTAAELREQLTRRQSRGPK